jgi:ribosomal-protein-alanine N-acetyltransferase
MRRPANIHTARLFLLALLPEDIDALIAGDLEAAKRLTGVTFLPDPQLGDLHWHLRAMRADCNQIAWRIRAIVERSSNTVVGSINLKGLPTADGDVEIGWGLVETARNKGYAAEAAAAVIAWVFQQPGVTSISATVPDENHTSQRVATRLGLVRTAETRRNLPLWIRKRADH